MQIARFCRDWFRIRQARNSALNFSTEHQDYAYFRLVFFQLMCKLQLRGGGLRPSFLGSHYVEDVKL